MKTEQVRINNVPGIFFKLFGRYFHVAFLFVSSKESPVDSPN